MNVEPGVWFVSGTLDGSLSARVNSGNVKLHITQLGNCDIQVKQGKWINVKAVFIHSPLIL